MGLTPLLPIPNQARLFEEREMLRDRGLRHPGSRSEGSDRLLPFPAKPLEQCSPSWVGKRPEEDFGTRILQGITFWLCLK